MRYIFVSLALLLTSLIASAENLVTKTYTLEKHGALALKVPESWSDSVTVTPNELPPTIKLSPKMGAQFTILVTPIWPANANIKPTTPDELRASVRQSADMAILQSVEDSIEVKELGPTSTGFYFTATDQAPKDGEFKYLNQGVIAVKDLLVSFTILTNDGQDEIVKEALSLLSSAERR